MLTEAIIMFAAKRCQCYQAANSTTDSMFHLQGHCPRLAVWTGPCGLSSADSLPRLWWQCRIVKNFSYSVTNCVYLLVPLMVQANSTIKAMKWHQPMFAAFLSPSWGAGWQMGLECTGGHQNNLYIPRPFSRTASEHKTCCRKYCHRQMHACCLPYQCWP